MSMRFKRRSGFMVSALIALVLIVVYAPDVSYAQPGNLLIKVKIQATEKLVEENIADAVKNEPISKAGKANVRKKLFGIAKPKVEKRINDEAASGRQSTAAEIADAIMKEILPQMDKFVADIAKAEAEELAEKTVTVDNKQAVAAAPVVSSPPRKSFVDWNVNNTESWIEAVKGIKTGGNWKIHTIIVSGNISIPISDGYTFGTVKKVTVTLEGDGTLSLSGNGSMLIVGIGQTVSLMGTLKLSGRDKNTGSMVVVDSGGTFRMAGGVTITGNTVNGDGGGVFVRSGDFIMDENSSVSGNSAKGNGGGVFVYNGEFTMYGSASVSNNTAKNGGGGVYVESGKFVMADSATVLSNTVWLGGGVYVGSAGTFIMRGHAKVAGNTVFQQGGGVYFVGKDFTVDENAAVSGNAASRQGRDVYFAGRTFTHRDGIKVSAHTAGIGSGVYFVGKAPAQSVGGGNDR